MECSGWESGFFSGPETCADIGEIGLTSERERVVEDAREMIDGYPL